DELVSAVIKFQVMHDISNTGNVGQQTWSALFSDSAKSMVSDYEYSQILANYEAMKVQRAEATEQMDQLTVKTSSTASKGAMNLTWSSSSAVLDIDSVQIDGYELWKSTSKSSGWQLLKSTTGQKFKNTSNIKKGTRYYYKVRAYREIGGQKIYSPWSNVTYKIAK
ncbi:MAG: fibronectin type III domain-containing protein, partial [Firmicutes bacterium]|nr:fibronectin type III domain-containing protein [Bacillota bacterium]